MDITRLRPEESPAVDELWKLLADVHQHDRPGSPAPQREVTEADIAGLRPDVHREYHLMHDGGRLAGYVLLVFPVRDNTHLMFVNLTVVPGRRRGGIGTALLELALRRGREEVRTTAIARAAEPLPHGPYRTTDGRDFLRAKGFDLVHSMWDFRLDMNGVAGKVEQDLLDESLPHAWEYDLLGWSGPTPEEHLPAVTTLANGFVSEVPFDEAPRTDRRVSTYARHRATGELVAHSVTSVAGEAPDDAHVEVTLVQPEHRGHRLGTIVKIENHRLLRREFPGVRTLSTTVAEVNTHMLAINHRLGFTEVDRQLDFQRRI